MVEEKKSNTLILIFIVIICFLIGYIIGDKFNFSTTQNKEEYKEENKEENKENIKIEEDQEIVKPTINNYKGVIYGSDSPACLEAINITFANYNGDLYYSVSFLENIQDLQNKINYFYETGTYEKAQNQIKSYINHTNGFKGKKLNIANVDKVIMIGSTQTCANQTGFIIIKKDGTISAISLYSLLVGKTEVTNISELKNIVNIEVKQACSDPRCGTAYFAIDKDGKEYKLDNYIKYLTMKYNEW